MKKLSSLTICLITLINVWAQTDDATAPIRQKHFNVSIRTLDHRQINGRLLAVNDSQLLLVKPTGQFPIPAENIQSFTLQRKNTVLKGALIGLGIGALTGIIAGFASGDDPVMPQSTDNSIFSGFNNAIIDFNNSFAMTAREKAVIMGSTMGLTGALVGTLVGLIAKKKFTIGGHKGKFRDLQAEIMMKLIRK